MKIFILAIFAISFTSIELFAQTDSLALVRAKWEKEKITAGVHLKTFQFNKSLFKSNQNLNMLEIKQKKNLIFDIGFDSSKLMVTSDFGKQAGVIAALNGTFFYIAHGGSVDYLRSDGKTINDNRLGKDGKRAIHQKSALVFNHGKLSIVKWNENPDWENTIDAKGLMVSGSLLILNKAEEKLDTANLFNKTRHPRSAIAITKNRRILLITIDGRNKNSEGMSLLELTKVLRWLKAYDAINLDGGGSTTLWIDNYKTNGVVNFPNDNKKWDHEGQRKVANVVLLRKKGAQ